MESVWSGISVEMWERRGRGKPQGHGCVRAMITCTGKTFGYSGDLGEAFLLH